MNNIKNGPPSNEVSMKDSRYLHNNSQTKNYIDFENIFMDGGTGAITNNKSHLKNESKI